MSKAGSVLAARRSLAKRRARTPTAEEMFAEEAVTRAEASRPPGTRVQPSGNVVTAKWTGTAVGYMSMHDGMQKFGKNRLVQRAILAGLPTDPRGWRDAARRAHSYRGDLMALAVGSEGRAHAFEGFMGELVASYIVQGEEYFMAPDDVAMACFEQAANLAGLTIVDAAHLMKRSA